MGGDLVACVHRALADSFARSEHLPTSAVGKIPRFKQPAWIELGTETLVVHSPANFDEPFIVPRRVVASFALHPAGKQARTRHKPEPAAAPVPSLAYFVGQPNLTVMFGEVFPLPKPRMINLAETVTDARGWRRAGRPVAGLRLALADPAAAEPALGAWLPEASKPAPVLPGVTPPGFLGLVGLRRQRTLTVLVGAVGLLLFVALEPRARHPDAAFECFVAAPLIGGVVYLAYRRAVHSRYDKWAVSAISLVLVF